MRNAIKSLALAGALVLGTGTAANAIIINIPNGNVSFVDGTTSNTTGITANIVNGANMVGMQVTATFADNSSDTATWASLGGVAGQALGTGGTWFLYESGATIHDAALVGVWSLYNANSPGGAITKLEINSAPGGVAFDINPNGAEPPSTPGSADGNAFRNNTIYGTQCSTAGVTYCADTNVAALTVTKVEYKNQLLVNGVDYNDMFTFLTIEFGGGGLPTAASNCTSGTIGNVDGTCSRFNFVADTDQAMSEIRQVPEPMTLALFGSGLLGLGALRRRRKAAK